ncbi:recombinase family protein [Granulicella aggregans]|uniref:recombinase family protein n=1 Tax=Granulicella aggregans TaxID=474949 RepID=UPI0021E0C0C6|nr:recombinase family protein [Granulicella aggregans]
MVAAARRGGKRVGYIRVSSADQNAARQLEGVELDKAFTDKASGKDVKRPQLQAALEYLRDGDVLIVHSMDRLARNLVDLRTMVENLTERGVQVRFEKENLIFTGDDTSAAKLLLSVMGAVAEFERSMLKERQREGIEIAKKAGVYRGRRPSLTPERASELRRRVADGEKRAGLAREFGISRQTLYQHAPVK